MTLDEAIKHADEVAKEQEKDEQFYTMSRPDKERRDSCRKCAEEHRQLAEWLKNYKQLLEQDTVPFDFELYQAGLMDLPKEMIEMLDKIRDEILEYIDDLDIATEICDIFDKYTAESEKA
jgi:sugar-specific transcriptional regulator TrmB